MVAPAGRAHFLETPRAHAVSDETTASEPCTVLIGGVDLLPALQQRAGNVGGEVIAFPDSQVRTHWRRSR